MDQCVVVECFVWCVVLQVVLYVGVQVFCKCFGKVIGQGFEYDCVVVVVVGFELFFVFFYFDVVGDGKQVDVVGNVGVFGCDEIGQVVVWVYYVVDDWVFVLLVDVVLGECDF